MPLVTRPAPTPYSAPIMSATPGTIENVSDTARWVAFYRAQESDRPDAHFHDRFARRLAGERGEAIALSMHAGARSSSWAMVVRTQVMDEIILRLVGQGVDTVLDLAAGLDARPWRLPLPPSLRWIDADLPGILGYKQQTLVGEKPVCDYRAVPIDLREGEKRRALFAEVAGQSRQTLLLTEGLLIYLDPEHVRTLAADLHGPPVFRWWLMDIMSPRLVKILLRRWGKKLEAGNAPFRFAPDEGTAFFAPFGWREAEFRSMWTESFRLKRTMPYASLWRVLSLFSSPERRAQGQRMAGITLLERT